MRRLLPTALVLAVLAAAAVAFAVTERLKLQKRPITPTKTDKFFSPVCRCPQARAQLGFTLRKADTVTFSVVDSEGRTVRRLVQGRRLAAGPHRYTWDGRDDAGALLPEGRYRPKARLAEAGRTFVFANTMRIDVTPPKLRVIAGPKRYSGRVSVSYRVSERATVLLLVDGEQRVRTRFRPVRGKVQWFGRVAGRPVPEGTYRVELVAVDLAGNRSAPAPAGTVRLGGR